MKNQQRLPKKEKTFPFTRKRLLMRIGSLSECLRGVAASVHKALDVDAHSHQAGEPLEANPEKLSWVNLLRHAFHHRGIHSAHQRLD